MRGNTFVLEAGRKRRASRYSRKTADFGSEGEGWNWKGKQDLDPKASGQCSCHRAIQNISTEQPAECCGISL